MEDEGFADDDFIEEVAWDYVGLHGSASIWVLQERARLVDAAGDSLSADTWRAIAEAAERILSADFGLRATRKRQSQPNAKYPKTAEDQ
ncbi:MAG TPA: hypothetical protein VHY35_24515 [Stellaceae bacterium]|nr:hypothetical protein [Stellaceae bacterium]